MFHEIPDNSRYSQNFAEIDPQAEICRNCATFERNFDETRRKHAFEPPKIMKYILIQKFGFI